MSILMMSMGLPKIPRIGVNARGYELFTASGDFVVEQTGLHRILLIGGGGGGGYDNGGAGGSGYVTYGTLELIAAAHYQVSVGTGGVSADGNLPIGWSGTASTFAAQGGSPIYLTAAGGFGGGSNNSESIGGNGGCGGGGYTYPGGDGGTGGGDGTASSFPRPGGTGQGATFTSSFSAFVKATVTPGAGGLDSRMSPLGPGGGGGGIVIDGDVSVTGGLDPVGNANPGIGYGAGSAGESDTARPYPSGPGANGMVLIEWLNV